MTTDTRPAPAPYPQQPKRARGLQPAKATQMHTRTELADQFWEKVERRTYDECWPWTGAKGSRKYGSVGRKAWGTRLAHRVAYTLQNGPIPAGKIVLHSCDNPACCNPQHLRLSSYADNGQDTTERRRSRQAKATTCAHGHELTEATTQVFEYKPGRFKRLCTTCWKLDLNQRGPMTAQHRRWLQAHTFGMEWKGDRRYRR